MGNVLEESGKVIKLIPIELKICLHSRDVGITLKHVRMVFLGGSQVNTQYWFGPGT
jgi:hypothetical protein